MSMEGGGSGTPDTTVEHSGGVVGLIQRNTDDGRCLLEKGGFLYVAVSCCSGFMVGQSCCCVQHLWATDRACCTVKE